MSSKEASPGQPPGSFDAVQAVEGVHEGAPRLADVVGKGVANPGQGIPHGCGVVVAAAARVDALVVQLAFLRDVLTGDEQVAQAGGGHGPRGGLAALSPLAIPGAVLLVVHLSA